MPMIQGTKRVLPEATVTLPATARIKAVGPRGTGDMMYGLSVLELAGGGVSVQFVGSWDDLRALHRRLGRALKVA